GRGPEGVTSRMRLGGRARLNEVFEVDAPDEAAFSQPDTWDAPLAQPPSDRGHRYARFVCELRQGHEAYVGHCCSIMGRRGQFRYSEQFRSVCSDCASVEPSAAEGP